MAVIDSNRVMISWVVCVLALAFSGRRMGWFWCIYVFFFGLFFTGMERGIRIDVFIR